MPAEVGLGAQDVGDLLFRPWRDSLVSLEFRNARLICSRDVVVRSVLVGHGESFGRYHRQRMPIPIGRDGLEFNSLVAPRPR